MPTKRTPLRRDMRRKITPEAVEAFRRMEAAAEADEWWEAHSVLHKELALPPWRWPAFEYPDAVCPYPTGSPAAKNWQANRDGSPEAFELYRALKAAAE
jgi:hypothetical protein